MKLCTFPQSDRSRKLKTVSAGIPRIVEILSSKWRRPVSLARRSEFIHGIKVRGNIEFLLRTREALTLLQPLEQFKVIQGNLKFIRQGQRSGMRAWAEKPTFIVGKATWRHSPLWYAGAIAHDAYHAKLYLDAKGDHDGTEPDVNAWTGAKAEKECLAFQ